MSTEQQPMLYGPPITFDQAFRVATAAAMAAEARGWPMVIAVVDSGGHLCLLHRMDQAQFGSIPLAQRKAETAVAFRRTTRAFEEALGNGGINLRLLAMRNVLPIEGGLPLIANGAVIGAIGVSGMKAAEDGEIARVGAGAFEP
jgi:glc operon protein GlcG